MDNHETTIYTYIGLGYIGIPMKQPVEWKLRYIFPLKYHSLIIIDHPIYNWIPGAPCKDPSSPPLKVSMERNVSQLRFSPAMTLDDRFQVGGGLDAKSFSRNEGFGLGFHEPKHVCICCILFVI